MSCSVGGEVPQFSRTYVFLEMRKNIIRWNIHTYASPMQKQQSAIQLVLTNHCNITSFKNIFSLIKTHKTYRLSNFMEHNRFVGREDSKNLRKLDVIDNSIMNACTTYSLQGTDVVLLLVIFSNLVSSIFEDKL